MRRSLALGLQGVLLCALACGCGASDPGARRLPTSPLLERTAVVAGPPEAGSVVTAPAAAGPGSAADPEGAAARALDELAGLLAVSPRELRLHAVTAQVWPDTCHGRRSPGRTCETRETSGWRVVLRDALDQPHTVDVSEYGVTWAGELHATGVLVALDEAQRLVVVQSQGRALVLRLWPAAAGLGVAVRPGALVAFGYDSPPRREGVAVLAWLEPLP